MVFDQMRVAVEAAAPDKLALVASAMATAYGAGGLTDEQYEQLDGLLAARRQVAQAAPAGMKRACIMAVPAAAPSPLEGEGSAPPIRQAPRTGSRPRSADSMARRRRWAAAGYLPPKLAQAFTPGEHAVLAVVGRQAATRGSCTLALGNIAALAGVSVGTVKRAMKQASVLGLVTIENRRVSYWRNDTNVVRIASREWAAWLALRLPRAAVPALGVGDISLPPRISGLSKGHRCGGVIGPEQGRWRKAGKGSAWQARSPAA